MRNLKRVLSLALALMMALSLMAFTGSASAAESTTIPVASDLYSDYDQTNYPEAIDVVTALRIVEGTDGELLPSGTLTRAEATTIAARMLLGVDAAETLPNVNTYTGYKDVDSVDHWAAAYIAFCDNQGIVSGVGGGNFNPNGQLTGVAFGKVILTVLGYDADKEGLKGDSWATNVIIALANAGISVEDSQGNPINLSQPITREQAMEMTYQALQTPLVEYPTNTFNQGAIATRNGASFVTTNLAKEQTISSQILSNTGTNNGTNSGTYTVEFAEKYFQKLKLNETVDAFGRPTHTWVLNNITIDSYDDNDLLVAEYDSEVNDVTVAGDLAGYYMPVRSEVEGATTGKIDNVPVNDYTKYDSGTEASKPNSNGNGQVGILYQNSTNPAKMPIGIAGDDNADPQVPAKDRTIAEAIAELTGNGRKVEIYVDKYYENIVNNIVVIDYAAGTLNVVRPVTNDRTNYAVTNAKWATWDGYEQNGLTGTTLTGSEFDNENVKDTVVYYDGAKSGDVVTCAMIDDVLYIYPTTTVENGVQSSKTAVLNTRETVKVVIGGETYTLGTSVNNVNESDFPNSKNSTTYYLDQYGYIVSSGKANLSYAYIVAVGGGVTPSPEGNRPVVKVRAVLEDGSANEYNLAVERDTAGKWYIANFKDKGPITTTSDETVREAVEEALATPGTPSKFTVCDYSIDETTNTITLYKLNTIEGIKFDSNINNTTKGTVAVGSATGTIKNGDTTVAVTAGTGNITNLYLNYETTFVIYNSKTLTATVKTGNTSLSSYSDGLKDAKLVAIANGSGTVVSYLVFATYDKVETTKVNTNYVYIDTDKKTTTSNGIVTFTAYQSDGTAIEVTDEAGNSGATAKIVDATGIYEYDTATGQVTAQVATAEKGGADYLQGGKVKVIANGLIEMDGTPYTTIYSGAINIGSENAVYVDVEKGHENGAYAFIVMGKNKTIETIFIVPDLSSKAAITSSTSIYTVKVADGPKANQAYEPAKYGTSVQNEADGTGKYSASIIVTTGLQGQKVTVTVTCDEKRDPPGTDEITVNVNGYSTGVTGGDNNGPTLTTTAETARGSVVGTVTFNISAISEISLSIAEKVDDAAVLNTASKIEAALAERDVTLAYENHAVVPSVTIPSGRTFTLAGSSTIPTGFTQTGSGKIAIAEDADVNIGASTNVTVSNIAKGATVEIDPTSKITVEGECNGTITVQITGEKTVSEALAAATGAVVGGVVRLPDSVVTGNDYYSDAWGMYIFTYDQNKLAGKNVLLTIEGDDGPIYQEIDSSTKNGRIFIPTTPFGGWTTTPDYVKYGGSYSGTEDLAGGTYTVTICATDATTIGESFIATTNSTAIMSGSFTISNGG